MKIHSELSILEQFLAILKILIFRVAILIKIHKFKKEWNAANSISVGHDKQIASNQHHIARFLGNFLHTSLCIANTGLH